MRAKPPGLAAGACAELRVTSAKRTAVTAAIDAAMAQALAEYRKCMSRRALLVARTLCTQE
jgi:hypothetical protein